MKRFTFKNRTKSILLLLITAIFFINGNVKAQSQQGGVSIQQYNALVDLYFSTNGPNWTNHTNWFTTEPVSNWFGVQVMNGFVRSVTLPSNNLSGIIPSSLQTLLSSGVIVNIANNKFTFAGLTQVLPVLSSPYFIYWPQADVPINQSGNNLTVLVGGNLSSNTYKWYKNDTLAATIIGNQNYTYYPAFVGDNYRVEVYNSDLNLTIKGDNYDFLGRRDSLALVDLYFSTNGWNWKNKTNWLTNAPLKTWFGIGLDGGITKGKRVVDIRLDSNNLEGALPYSIGDISNVQAIQMVNNKLNGQIPASIGNLSNLFLLYLNGNKLSGEMPSSIGNLSNLMYCTLHNNQLSGSIPSSLLNLHKLLVFWLSHNQLSGIIPPSFFNLTSGPNVDIDNNKFTFSGLENYGVLGYTANINPQSTIPIIQSSDKLSVAVGGTLSNNTYYWYNGNTLVATIIADSIFTPTSFGKYSVKATNAIINDKLTLYSDTSLVNNLPTTLCNPMASTILNASIAGAIYQWQVSTDGIVFNNIVNNTTYNGVNTSSLSLSNVPSLFNRYQYRCVVDGFNDGTYVLQFKNSWINSPSNNEWSTPANWSCGNIPDANTDVTINSGEVIVTQNAICRSLTVGPNATVTVNTGTMLTILH